MEAETQREKKSSIFVCKNCKTADVKVAREPKAKQPLTEIKLMPAGVHQDCKYVA